MTGTLSGIGCGLVFRFGGRTGGTDNIYQILERYFHIKIGKSLFLITLVVSLLCLDLTYFIYTLISWSILSYILNKVKYLEFTDLFKIFTSTKVNETLETLDSPEEFDRF